MAASARLPSSRRRIYFIKELSLQQVAEYPVGIAKKCLAHQKKGTVSHGGRQRAEEDEGLWGQSFGMAKGDDRSGADLSTSLKMTDGGFSEGRARCARGPLPGGQRLPWRKAPPLGRETSHRGGDQQRVRWLPTEKGAGRRLTLPKRDGSLTRKAEKLEVPRQAIGMRGF